MSNSYFCGLRSVEGKSKIELCAARWLSVKAEQFSVREGWMKKRPSQGQFGPEETLGIRIFRKGDTPNCFFTESLILAQNERWRRV
jgi:hypothetical protein